LIDRTSPYEILRDVIGRSFILAYSEDVTLLEASLMEEGLHPQVLRATYNQAQLKYARSVRTFMNHYHAWSRAAGYDEDYTLICESDFVPCIGVGGLPTFWPLQNPLAWGYLYQGSPRLLAVVGNERFLRGHTAPLVSYVINKAVAEILIQFYRLEMAGHDLTAYWTFDSHLQWYAMGQGAEAYIPSSHYGEHGGFPNREHKDAGKLPRGGVHRADNLAKPLHFMPPYARGSATRYIIERCKARALGWARLFSGRWIIRTNVYSLSSIVWVKMFFVGAKRLMSGRIES
jgi:hypothetical protein